MDNVLHMPGIPVDKHGLPHKHWAGRTKAARWLREFINEHTPTHLTENEATDATEEMLREYLREQR